MVNTIVEGCEVKEKGAKQVRTGNNLNVVHQNIRWVTSMRIHMNVCLYYKREDVCFYIVYEMYNT